MLNKARSHFTGATAIALALGVFAPMTVLADDSDPPSRAGRLAYAQGSVSFEPAGTEDWVSAVVNRPLTTGDRVWSDVDGRAEVQLDGSLLRLSSNTAVSFLNLSDNVTQVQLSAGTLVVRVRRLDDSEAYEIDTPNLAFTIARPGLYRLTVDPTGTSTAIRVRSGAGAVTGGGTSYSVQENEDDVFTGTDQLVENGQQYGTGEDQFDAWSSSRDNRWQNSASARYVSADVVGYEDLDDHGAWRPAPGYGNVWFPRGVGADWAPYHNGHWAYIEPWGYSWVDDQPWGFAPFHYGRWISVDGAWGWVPSPPRVQGVAYVRPVYAPALVAWVGTGAAVAWFALGPREVYVPSYPVSRNYVNNVNVSNTTVNTTVVNNVYNTTVTNNTTNVKNVTNVTNTKNVTNVTNITYANQRVPGAVTATTHEAFASAQPVARNTVKVDARAIASAPVRTLAPPITPAKQAVLGTGPAAARKPPAAVQTRVVVAKVAPPPPPPSFEKRQQAIKNNGGKPLTTAQVRQIQPAAQQHAAVVKVAPPAKPGTPQSAKIPVVGKPALGASSAPKGPAAEAGKPAAAQAKVPAPGSDKKPADRKEDRPANGSGARPAEPAKPAEAQAKSPATPGEKKPADRPVASGGAARPTDMGKPPAVQAKPPETSALKRPPADANRPAQPAPAPAAPKEKATAASSAAANAQLEAKHQQEQAQLHAKQEQERQKAQQQLDLQRKQLEQQKSDQAKKQQLAQQQEQAKQLEQKHAQEQQALQQKQQLEKQQAAKPSAKDKKDTKDDLPTK